MSASDMSVRQSVSLSVVGGYTLLPTRPRLRMLYIRPCSLSSETTHFLSSSASFALYSLNTQLFKPAAGPKMAMVNNTPK